MKIQLLLLATFAVAAIFVFTNCNSTKKTSANFPPDSKLIEMYKGACFGKCPVFTLTVYRNGVVDYEGKRFTDKMGVYSKKLDATQLAELKKAIADAQMMTLKDEYESRIPDLPMTKITYFEGEKNKTVAGKEDRPEKLMAAEKILVTISKSEGWTLQKAPDYGLKENEIPNEIIVQLKEGIDATKWVEENSTRFSNLVIKEQITPNMNYWLLTFDPSATPPTQMLNMIKEKEGVVNAEFNKMLKER